MNQSFYREYNVASVASYSLRGCENRPGLAVIQLLLKSLLLGYTSVKVFPISAKLNGGFS